MANATIFQQYLQPQRGVSDYLADYDRQDLARLQLAGQQRQNALASLMYGQQVKDAQAKADESNALRRIASGWGADTTDDQRISSLRSAGMPGLMDRADALEKQALERQKAKASVGKDQAETLKQQLESLKFLAGGVMANPTPENAAGALAMWERLTGQQASEDRAALAQLTTPEQIKQWAASKALTADKLLPQVQIRNTGGSTDTLAIDPLTGKPTVTSSIRNTVSPDAQLSAATSSANNAATIAAEDRRAAATLDKPQWDSERGVWAYPSGATTPAVGQDGKPLGPKDKAPAGYRATPDGKLEAIPGGPADKIGEAQQKQVIGTQNLSGAIKEYRDELANWSKTGAVNPRARAAMGTKYNNMMLQAKEAYNLGVLNGPDYTILTSIVTDPTSVRGTFTPNSALDQQASELDRIMKGVAATSSQRRPQDAAPTVPSDMPADIAALLKKHGGK